MTIREQLEKLATEADNGAARDTSVSVSPHEIRAISTMLLEIIQIIQWTTPDEVLDKNRA